MTVFFASTAQLGQTIETKELPSLMPEESMQQPQYNYQQQHDGQHDGDHHGTNIQHNGTRERHGSVDTSSVSHDEVSQNSDGQQHSCDGHDSAAEAHDGIDRTMQPVTEAAPQGDAIHSRPSPTTDSGNTTSPRQRNPQRQSQQQHRRGDNHAAAPSQSRTMQAAINERNETVKNLFGAHVGACIKEFSVTYNRVMGRLFVTPHAILYYCNIFGFERRLCLQFRDITHINAYRSTSVRIFMVDCEDYVFKKFTENQSSAKWFQGILAQHRAAHSMDGHSDNGPNNDGGGVAEIGTPEDLSVASNGASSPTLRHTTTFPFASMSTIASGSHHARSRHGNRSHLCSEMSLHLDGAEAGSAPARPRSQSVPILIDPCAQHTPALTSSPLLSSPASSPPHPTRILQRRWTGGSLQAPMISPRSTSRPHSPLPTVIGDARRWNTTGAAAPTYQDASVPHQFASTSTQSHTTRAQAGLVGNLSSGNTSADKEAQRRWLNIQNQTLKEVVVDSMQLDGCSPQQFFDLFLADDAPHAITRYQRDKIGDLRIQISPWQPQSQASLPDLQRTVEFDHPLNKPIGPSHVKTFRRQTVRHFGRHGIVMESKTQVQGIPMVDCFHILDQWRISAEGTLTVSFQVVFTKFTILQAMIQKNSREETKKWFQGYLQIIENAVSTLALQEMDKTSSWDERHENETGIDHDTNSVNVMEAVETMSQKTKSLAISAPTPTSLGVTTGATAAESATAHPAHRRYSDRIAHVCLLLLSIVVVLQYMQFRHTILLMEQQMKTSVSQNDRLMNLLEAMMKSQLKEAVAATAGGSDGEM